MRAAFTVLLLCGVTIGCQRLSSPNTAKPDMPSSRTTPKSERPAQPADLIEITPAARKALFSHATSDQKANRWWLFISFQPGGCQGFQNKLDMDFSGPGTTDTEFVCGDIRCFIATKQLAFVQGARVDYVTNEKVTGFELTFPNRTVENRNRLNSWVESELRLAGAILPTNVPKDK